MASNQVNGTPNGNLGKRKKPRASKGSYLSKWLDKTMHHIQDSTPSMDTYDSFVNANLNWQANHSQFAPAYDPCRLYCNPEPMSLPTLPTYYTPPVLHPHYGPEYRYIQSANKSIQVQRPRQRRRGDKAEEIHCTPMETPNGTLTKNYKNLTDCQDFTSLPPIVTSVGDTTSNSDLNTNEKEDNRRFSDPCINGLPDVARPANGDVESGSEESSMSGSQVGGRLLSCLLDQIAALKMANDRLNKDLQDTKAELMNVRQHNSVWQKSSSSSLGGTPHHSPLVSNGLLNAQYSPGLLTDLVREIREAARVREEAMYARVRQMVHERSENGITSNDVKFSDRSLEDIKSSLRASEADKRRMMERVNKLEDELRLMRVTAGLETKDNGNAITTNGNTEEAEHMRLRKEVADMKRAKQNAEEHALKLERLVTQLRSKFNGLQLSPSGPESLPSEPEHDHTRVRRTSVNSNSTTVVFGPVTDL